MELCWFFSQSYKKFLGYMLYPWDFSYSLGVMQKRTEIPVPKVLTPSICFIYQTFKPNQPCTSLIPPWDYQWKIDNGLPSRLTARNDAALSYMCFLEPWSQSVVLEQAALVSLGSLLQIQNFRFRLAESESILLTKYPCNF